MRELNILGSKSELEKEIKIKVRSTGKLLRAKVKINTNYGKKIVSAVIKDNLLGVQFHPEKSQEKGKKFLEEFLDWKPE